MDKLNSLPRFVSSQPEVKLPTVIRGVGHAQPALTTIEVVDGDTVRSGGTIYRLVGFDTPEAGLTAKCERERILAARAAERLRHLVALGGLNLRRVPCACPQGTEGMQRCNFGRLCATLTVRGSDVAEIMIGAGLARRYVCGGTSCPPRGNWCG
jgi:endonuclease YncB( thermonuclease family)